MNWPSSTQQGTDPFADLSGGKLDQRRVLMLIALLSMPGFGWICFQSGNRGHAWLFGLLTASEVVIPARLLHKWYHYRSMILPQRSPVTRSWTVDYPVIFSGLTWRQRLHYVTLPVYYLVGVVLPGNRQRLVNGNGAAPGRA